MIYVIRIVFLLLVSAVAMAYVTSTATESLRANNPMTLYLMLSSVVLAFAIFVGDLLIKRKNLSSFSGVFFGILVGVLIALCLGFIIDQIASVFVYKSTFGVTNSAAKETIDASNESLRSLINGVKLLVAVMATYLTVTFIVQTKDDFRFIIPYVEFTRATKGPRPLVLDTSVIIDGRIADMAATGIFESRLLLPRFVLNELQAIADSGDKLKRSRGRRGLDILQRLQGMPKIDLHIWDGTLPAIPESEGVDQKLVALAQQENGRVVTNDFNLNKIAQLRGIDVININLIADALKPVYLPGEHMHVRVVKAGESSGQGVGYLEDGTMVVIEGARDRIGAEVDLTVTNALQTAAGKMIFGRIDSANTDRNAASAKTPAKAPPAA